MIAVGLWGAALAREQSALMLSMYQDRVVPLAQLKRVADQYAVNIVDAAHKAADGALTPEQTLQAVGQARDTIRTAWTAYLATELVSEEKRLIAQLVPLMAAADASVLQLESLVRARDAARVSGGAEALVRLPASWRLRPRRWCGSCTSFPCPGSRGSACPPQTRSSHAPWGRVPRQARQKLG